MTRSDFEIDFSCLSVGIRLVRIKNECRMAVVVGRKMKKKWLT